MLYYENAVDSVAQLSVVPSTLRDQNTDPFLQGAIPAELPTMQAHEALVPGATDIRRDAVEWLGSSGITGGEFIRWVGT